MQDCWSSPETSTRSLARCLACWTTRLCASAWRPVHGACATGCRPGTTPRTGWQHYWRGSRAMGDSLAEWLALREPVDAAARSVALTRAIAGALPRDRALRIVDLGTGRGSNRRYLRGRLALPQRRLLVDPGARLLAALPYA